MRDFASCFGEHAVKVSDYTCSGSSGVPSVQTAVTTLYRSRLSTRKELHIRVTWHQSSAGPDLSISVHDDLSPDLRWPDPTNARSLRQKKGSQSYGSGNSVIGLFWDISLARYGAGLEPIKDYYIVVIVDAEFALLLGEMSREFVKSFEGSVPVADASMVHRTEQVLGRSLFSCKARFHDDRGDHDIVIKCKGDGADANGSELLVSIDRRKVVHVRRPKWNFRGNQTIFVDGLPLDVLWDLHDWFFCIPSGSATFMFRVRSSLRSRLWLEEKIAEREQQGTSQVSVLIQATKSL